ncbi:MAG: amino acid adenylation domain-containing protein [Pseudomonadales bacterium]
MSLHTSTVDYQIAQGFSPNDETASNPLEHLSAKDKELFERFGWGATVVPRHNLIHLGFEHYVAEQPQSIAIITDCGRQCSYADLQQRINFLAQHLHQQGISAGDSVCLYMHRGIELVAAIFACLKLGASYVPQDMQVCPQQQRSVIAQVVKAKSVLTTSEYVEMLESDFPGQLLAVDSLLESMPHKVIATTFEDVVDSSDTAVVIFTSGTTGTPNGVQVSHRNLCNILLTSPGDLSIAPGDVVTQLLNIAFDMAAWEILGALCNGATLYIRGDDIQRAAEQASVIIATPSVLSRIAPERCSRIRVVAVAGEPCPLPLAQRWSSQCTFYNSCGPTETTIINTAATYTHSDPVLSIGAPTPNNTVYVLNDVHQPCAIGEVGEMWAGGDCVTKGYINNAALTNERYRPDPFIPGRTMFRTRDLGRWCNNGELEHLGRVDDQVKIRGFRVELDAVSAVLERTQGCHQAVALKFNNRHLVAFVSPANVDIQCARESIAKALPYYCQPLFILSAKSFPQTIRGKLDKRALLQWACQYQREQELQA